MKFLLPILFVLVATVIHAQDIICTQDDKVLEVQIVKVDPAIIFYRELGDSEIKAINRKSVKSYNLASEVPIAKKRKLKNKIGSTENVTDVGPYNLVKKKNLSKKYALLSGLFGVLYLVEQNKRDSNGQLIFFTATTSIVCAIMSLRHRKEKDTYDFIRNNDLGFLPLSKEDIQLLEKQRARDCNLSASSKGLGIQLNF